MLRSLVIGLSLPLLAIATGCGSAAPAAPTPPPPPSAPPTPTSVTVTNPGGDADDPEKAALERLSREPWGRQRNRWNALSIPLVDSKNWKRVRIWSHPTRATYRYGDNHRAVDTTLYTSIEGPNDPDTCLARFMEQASTTAQAYGVHLGDSQLIRMSQIIDDVAKPMLVKVLDGRVTSILAHDDYVGAVAVYQSFPGTCLVRGFAVVSTNHKELAVKVRDRWVSEGAQNLAWGRRIKAAPAVESR